MILLNGILVEPTIFPDGTTQVWKLPEEILNRYGKVAVTWRYESLTEFFTVAQIRTLFPDDSGASLYMPYLPFARQDKRVANDRTWALHTFGKLINSLNFGYVSALDVHNEEATRHCIRNFQNQSPQHIHLRVVEKIVPNTIIFPDLGAVSRYGWLAAVPRVVFEKDRDQETGKIIGHKLKSGKLEGSKFLIVDDICDGGATFISIAKEIKKAFPDTKPEIHLFVTHGIFSKGREVLEKEGITIHTTNSLPQNKHDGIPV